MTVDLIDSFIERYRREYDFFEQAARLAYGQLESALASSGIRAMVTYRAKRPDRLDKKLRQRFPIKNYKSTQDIYRDIADFAGVRVALYFPGERSEVDKIVRSVFDLSAEPKIFPDGLKPTYKKRFSGYWAQHYRVRLRDNFMQESHKRYTDALIEVQVASVLMHSWSEVEHDLVYKPLQGQLSEDEYAILDELNGLVLAGEIALERLQRAVEARVTQEGSKFSSHFELASFLIKSAAPILKAGPTESALGRVDTLFELLLKLDVNTPEKIRPLVASLHGDVEKRSISDQIIDQVVVSDESKYKLYVEMRKRDDHESYFKSNLDNTSDAVLEEFLKQWIEFEKTLLDDIRAQRKDGREYVINKNYINLLSALDSESKKKLEWIRILRNRAVHGHGEIEINEMREATVMLRKILKTIRSEMKQAI
jgi:ppGpp synthetase/RelA/SpoT-type nucleotidyltranferase